MSSGILQEKNAVVFGAGGPIGAAVAEKFAGEGARVFLAGRNQSSGEDVARQIAAGGGRAHAATVSALDDAAVKEYLARIVKQTVASMRFSTPLGLLPGV
jgi:NAD(P)-dependent dehydrogenase (short-subunit alcohol dehydrogenase family)